MCGIAGLLLPNSADPAVVARMLERIVHRGRDGSHVWRDHSGALVLGHNRLSIIDLSPLGAQPLSNEDGTVWVVLNGEIYNYVELRADLVARGHRFRGQSDTEVIPHLYEEFGPAFVDRLHGMFALAVWDSRRRALFLARDRAGKKPLFVADLPGGGMAFASEMKALFEVPGVDLGIREQGLWDYLGFGVVPGPETVYRGIRRVPPAHLLERTIDGAERSSPYWNLSFVPKSELDFDEAVDALLPLLRRAVRLRLRSDVPVGVFLSGGIDSGLVTALAAEESGGRLKTFSVGFEDDPRFDERPLAGLVAAKYDTDHTEIVLRSDPQAASRVIAHYDEPYAAPSAIPSFAVAEAAARHVRVVLNGDGADEAFCGYRHFLAARLMRRLDAAGAQFFRGAIAAGHRLLPAPRNGRGPYQFLHRFLRALAATDDARYMVLTTDRLDEDEARGLLSEEWRARGERFRSPARHAAAIQRAAPGLGALDAMMIADFRLMLADDHLVKMDMASMASTLEARSPFLDHHLLEFAASLREDVRLPGRSTKPLLRTLAARLLPPEVAGAPKRGFEIPLLRWMRADLADELRDRVLSTGSLSRRIFDGVRLAALLERDGWDEKRWAAITWTLLCMEVWWEAQAERVAPAGATAPSRTVPFAGP